jgi:hypothetical protein
MADAHSNLAAGGLATVTVAQLLFSNPPKNRKGIYPDFGCNA